MQITTMLTPRGGVASDFFQRTSLLIGVVILLVGEKFAEAGFFGNWKSTPDEERKEKPPLQCDLYLANSTIPDAGIGIFSTIAKQPGDSIGNGDKAIPLVDAYWHNGFAENFFNPTADYVWDGVSMGMRLELFDVNDISAFWPGIDAMVNSHAGLQNLEKATPMYDPAGVHRARHHSAGSSSPYDAAREGSGKVIREIPAGAELFKSYGDNWFLQRTWLGQIPLSENYQRALELAGNIYAGCEEYKCSAEDMYDELFLPFQKIWDSRTLNAYHDFSWKEMEQALDSEDIGVLLQANATRSVEYLQTHGRCLDHIVHKRSTIDGAGAGAFAKRDLPEGTIVTGTPLLVFPDISWFDMYDYLLCPDGETMARDISQKPYGQQLLLNYCFGHPNSTVVLCPYGSGVNYINHNQTRANVKVQWAKNGVMSHRDECLERPLKGISDYSTKVAFDYVATRDIEEGEEIFLDYGDVWETNFEKLRQDWLTFERSHLETYVSATEYNAMYPKDVLFTTNELEEHNPHPDNLCLRCHYLVDESRTEEGVFFYEGDWSELEHNWEHWSGDSTGYNCEVLLRMEENENTRYVIRYQTPLGEEQFADPITVSNVPREAIKFFDKPYTTDLHMIGSFRQPLGIPDNLLPNAWRNRSGESKSSATRSTEYDESVCDRNPHQEEYRHQSVEDESLLQAQEPQTSSSSRRARHRLRTVRGRGR